VVTKAQATLVRVGIRIAVSVLVLALIAILSRCCYAQKWDSAKVAIVKKYECQYGLPHGIYRALNLQENSGKVDSFAKPRVESGWFNVGEYHYNDGVRLTWTFLWAHPEVATVVPFEIERLQEVTSWGEIQTMGFNLRDMGYTKPYFVDMTFEERAKYGVKFLYLRCWKPAKGNLARALKYYNGPKIKQSYIDHVTAALRKFSY
jgi:hypothetical protein